MQCINLRAIMIQIKAVQRIGEPGRGRRRRSMRSFVVIFLLLLLSVFNYPATADLVLSAPPREKPERGEALYGPLAESLTKLLGEKVTYVHPNNWLEYQHDLRKDKYDIVFDGPHFISWRIEHLHNDVLVKLPGTLEFVIVVKSDDKEIKKLKNLIGKKICGIPPPNLASLTVIDQFKNPVRQPIIWGIRGGNAQVFRAFDEGQCRAAALLASYYEKNLSADKRKNTRVLFRSKALPNQAISVSTRVSAMNRSKIIRSLTIGQGRKAAEPIAKRFSGKDEDFVAATKKEYLNHYGLLEDAVFGW